MHASKNLESPATCKSAQHAVAAAGRPQEAEVSAAAAGRPAWGALIMLSTQKHCSDLAKNCQRDTNQKTRPLFTNNSIYEGLWKWKFTITHPIPVTHVKQRSSYGKRRRCGRASRDARRTARIAVRMQIVQSHASRPEAPSGETKHHLASKRP